MTANKPLTSGAKPLIKTSAEGPVDGESMSRLLVVCFDETRLGMLARPTSGATARSNPSLRISHAVSALASLCKRVGAGGRRGPKSPLLRGQSGAARVGGYDTAARV